MITVNPCPAFAEFTTQLLEEELWQHNGKIAIYFEQFVAVSGMAVCVTGLMVRTGNYSPLHWPFFVYSRINGKSVAFICDTAGIL